MNKKIIAVDVDSTVADLHTEWIRRYNEDYNDTIRVEDVKSWGIHEYAKAGTEIYKYINYPDLYLPVQRIPFSLAGVKTLRNLGYRVIFPTANYNKGKIQWLFDHEYVNSDDDWVVLHDKSLIKADYLVDDKPENVRDFDGIGILFDQPWNLDFTWKPRFDSWISVVDFIVWYEEQTREEIQ